MKPAYSVITVLVLTLIVIIVGGELYLRHQFSAYTTALCPSPCQKDNSIGWINKKAIINSPSFSNDRDNITITQSADGRRITSDDGLNSSNVLDQLVVVGGSFTQGYGLSDEETWPWLLQQKTPCIEILNYGTTGYGTYQCLLTLERVLPTLSSPKIVIYGFLEHHLIRNVSPPDWQAMLAMNRKGEVWLPYVDIDEQGKLVRYPPTPVKRWPLDHSSAMVRLIEIMYLKTFQSRNYFEKMDAAWQLIMIEMRNLCARHGCRLVVMILGLNDQSQKQFYTTFLKMNHIDYIDGSLEFCPELLLEKDPFHHPNPKANAVWADILSSHIYCRENEQIDFVKRGP